MDRVVLALLIVFACFDLVIGRYWLIHAPNLAALAATDPWARLFAWFAPIDRSYFDHVTQGPLGLVAVDLVIVQPASLILVIAIFKRWALRVPLQIAVGVYGVYAVVIGWWIAAISGFPDMAEPDAGSIALLVCARLPWLLGYLVLLVSGSRAALRARPRPGRSGGAIGLGLFFILVALTAELYYVTHAFHMTEYHDALRDAFELYGIGDRGYFDQASWFEVGLETFHIAVTVPAYIVLIWAVVRRHRIRWVLQLSIGTYVAMSVLIYFAAKHMTGYVETPKHDAFSFFMLAAPNLPWLLGNLYLAVTAGRAIADRQREVDA